MPGLEVKVQAKKIGIKITENCQFEYLILLRSFNSSPLYRTIPYYVDSSNIHSSLDHNQKYCTKHHDRLYNISPHNCLQTSDTCIKYTNNAYDRSDLMNVYSSNCTDEKEIFHLHKLVRRFYLIP